MQEVSIIDIAAIVISCLAFQVSFFSLMFAIFVYARDRGKRLRDLQVKELEGKLGELNRDLGYVNQGIGKLDRDIDRLDRTFMAWSTQQWPYGTSERDLE